MFHLHPCPVRHNKNNKPSSSQKPNAICITTARITPVVLPAHWVRDGFGIPAEGGGRVESSNTRQSFCEQKRSQDEAE